MVAGQETPYKKKLTNPKNLQDKKQNQLNQYQMIQIYHQEVNQELL